MTTNCETKLPTVLVVDDEPSICLVVGEMLRECRLNVLTAQDGYDALRQLESLDDRVALAILDYYLPGMECEKLISELRKGNDQMKLVVVSGHTGQLFDDPDSLGIDAMVPKPFSVRKLADLVLSFIHDQDSPTETNG